MKSLTVSKTAYKKYNINRHKDENYGYYNPSISLSAAFLMSEIIKKEISKQERQRIRKYSPVIIAVDGSSAKLANLITLFIPELYVIVHSKHHSKEANYQVNEFDYFIFVDDAYCGGKATSRVGEIIDQKIDLAIFIDSYNSTYVLNDENIKNAVILKEEKKNNE